MAHDKTTTFALLFTASALLLTACGKDGGGTGPTEAPAMSAAEAQDVAASLYVEVLQAIGSAEFSRAGGPAARALRAPLPVTALARPTQSIDAPCTLGGRIVGTISLTDGTNDDGTGTVTANVSATPRGCIVSAGSRQIPVDGDPSLEYRFSVSFRNGEPSSNLVWRATGGIRWPNGRCAVDYTITVTPEGDGAITGTLCGERIDTRL